MSAAIAYVDGLRAEFCVWVASQNFLVDVDLTVERLECGTMVFESNFTHTVWMAYCQGRHSEAIERIEKGGA